MDFSLTWIGSSEDEENARGFELYFELNVGNGEKFPFIEMKLKEELVGRSVRKWWIRNNATADRSI